MINDRRESSKSPLKPYIKSKQLKISVQGKRTTAPKFKKSKTALKDRCPLTQLSLNFNRRPDTLNSKTGTTWERRMLGFLSGGHLWMTAV